MVQHLLRLLVFSISLAFSSHLAAMEFHHSGFISLSAGQHNREDVGYFGYDDELSFENDTVFGLQFDIKFNEKLSFTTQGIAEGYSIDGKDNFQPKTQWFYLSYKFAPRWNTRIGRLGYPLFPLSDFQNIGFAYQWLRPPTSIYNASSRALGNVDGIDLLFNDKWGDYDVAIQLIYGQIEKKLNTNILDFSNMTGINIGLVRDVWEVNYYLNYFNADVTIVQIKPLLTSLSASPFTEVAAIPALFDMEDTQFIRQTLSVRLDLDPWLFQAEHLLLDSDESGVASDNKGWYFSAMYQFDLFTPYIYYGTFNADYNNSIQQGLISAVNSVPSSEQATIALIASAITPLDQDEDITAIGVRFDPWTNTALKLEALHVDPNGTKGQMETVGNINAPGEPVTIYSIRLDYIF